MWYLVDMATPTTDPTNVDDTFFGGVGAFTGAGQVATVNSTASCLSMNWTGATNTPTLVVSNNLITYGDVTFILAMSYPGAVAKLYFNGAATQTLTTNGLTISGTIDKNSSASLVFVDALTVRQIQFEQGNITVNALLTVISGGFNDGGTATAKSLTMGTQTVNTLAWSFPSGGLTVTANTATINITGTGALAGGNVNYNGASFNLNGTAHTVSGAFTCANLTRNGTATNANSVTFTSGTTVTVTGTAAMIGNSRANQLLVQSSTLGTAATITAGNWTGTTNTDFMDITSTNAVDFSAGGTVANAGGNTGMTFPAPTADQNYTAAAGGSFSTTANWSGGRIPLVGIDNVVITQAFNSGVTLTWDMPRMGKSIDVSGMSWTGTATTVLAGIEFSIFGSWTQKIGMTISTVGVYARGRGNYIIVANGVPLPFRYINAVTGVYTLQDDAVFSVASALQINNGTLDLTNRIVTLFYIRDSDSVATRGVNFTNSIVTLMGTVVTNKINFSTGTYIFTGSTIILTNSTANAQTFTGGGLTYNNVTVAGAGNYALTVMGNNKFNSIYLDESQAAKTIVATGTTQTVNSMSRNINTNVLTLTGGTLVSKSGSIISMDYLSISGSTATPTVWYAGTHSTNGGSNVGWKFTNPILSGVTKLIGVVVI